MTNLIPLGDINALDYGYTGPSVGDAFQNFDIPNRIALKNGTFRMLVGGNEVSETLGPINVVIESFNQASSRMFYAGAYDPKAEATAPACFSSDGRTPSKNSTQPQALSCDLCPNNIKDAAGRKHCKTFKRVVVTLAEDASMTPYVLDIAALGLFGDDNAANQQYNFKNYATLLTKFGAPVNAVITSISSDRSADVSKLFFKPLGMVPVDIYKARQAAIDKEQLERYTQIEVAQSSGNAQLGRGSVGTQQALPPPTPVVQAPVTPAVSAPVVQAPVVQAPVVMMPVMAPQPVPQAVSPVVSPMVAPPVFAPQQAAQPVFTPQHAPAQQFVPQAPQAPAQTGVAVGVVSSVEDLLAGM